MSLSDKTEQQIRWLCPGQSETHKKAREILTQMAGRSQGPSAIEKLVETYTNYPGDHAKQIIQEANRLGLDGFINDILK